MEYYLMVVLVPETTEKKEPKVKKEKKSVCKKCGVDTKYANEQCISIKDK